MLRSVYYVGVVSCLLLYAVRSCAAVKRSLLSAVSFGAWVQKTWMMPLHLVTHARMQFSLLYAVYCGTLYGQVPPLNAGRAQLCP